MEHLQSAPEAATAKHGVENGVQALTPLDEAEAAICMPQNGVASGNIDEVERAQATGAAPLEQTLPQDAAEMARTVAQLRAERAALLQVAAEAHERARAAEAAGTAYNAKEVQGDALQESDASGAELAHTGIGVDAGAWQQSASGAPPEAVLALQVQPAAASDRDGAGYGALAEPSDAEPRANAGGHLPSQQHQCTELQADLSEAAERIATLQQDNERLMELSAEHRARFDDLAATLPPAYVDAALRGDRRLLHSAIAAPQQWLEGGLLAATAPAGFHTGGAQDSWGHAGIGDQQMRCGRRGMEGMWDPVRTRQGAEQSANLPATWPAGPFAAARTDGLALHSAPHADFVRHAAAGIGTQNQDPNSPAPSHVCAGDKADEAQHRQPVRHAASSIAQRAGPVMHMSKSTDAVRAHTPQRNSARATESQRRRLAALSRRRDAAAHVANSSAPVGTVDAEGPVATAPLRVRNWNVRDDGVAATVGGEQRRALQ